MTGPLKSALSKLLPQGKTSPSAGGTEEGMNEQQEQLLRLFEKRNEIKREFGRTLDELETLRAEHEVLEKQARIDAERLHGLEALLSDPASCHNAIIYYRLDVLWKSCHQQLAKRRTELEQKFEELERAKLLEEFKAHAVQQQKQLEQKFQLVDEAYQEKAEEVSRLQQQLGKSRQVWHYFRRKRLVQAILEAEENMAPAISQREECLAELERVRDREPPAWKGLSTRSRREINLQLIALAQYLVVHFSENDLATLAHSTQAKLPGEWRIGTNEECLAMLRPIRDIVMRLKQDDRRAERLQRRLEHLRQLVSYEGNADTVPDKPGMARIAKSPGVTDSFHIVDADIPINVLEMDFWSINTLLLPPLENSQAG